MITFLLSIFASYYNLLIILATLPAIYLLKKVYRLDHLEVEPKELLIALVIGGLFATVIAYVLETLGTGILSSFLSEEDPRYNFWLYFGVVACSEEGAKYFMMKRKTWSSGEFNCYFDAIVYSTFTALGFALFENISYVFSFGISTAFVRALTAVPAHGCFGVLMGLFYGLEKAFANEGYFFKSKLNRLLALLIPIIIHGTYDYIATMEDPRYSTAFVVFIIGLFLICSKLIKSCAKADRYL